MLGLCASVQSLLRTVGPTAGGFLYVNYGISSIGTIQCVVNMAVFVYLLQRGREKTTEQTKWNISVLRKMICSSPADDHYYDCTYLKFSVAVDDVMRKGQVPPVHQWFRSVWSVVEVQSQTTRWKQILLFHLMTLTFTLESLFNIGLLILTVYVTSSKIIEYGTNQHHLRLKIILSQQLIM